MHSRQRLRRALMSLIETAEILRSRKPLEADECFGNALKDVVMDVIMG